MSEEIGLAPLEDNCGGPLCCATGITALLETMARAALLKKATRWPPGWGGWDRLTLGSPGVYNVSVARHPGGLLNLSHILPKRKTGLYGQRLELELEPRCPVASQVVVNFPETKEHFLAFFTISRLITYSNPPDYNPIHNAEEG